MNRTILTILLAAMTIFALAPPAGATAGSWTSPAVCSEIGTACTQATVDWRLVPAGESPCTYIEGTGDETTYSCKIRWDLSLHTGGTASCGWAWMEVTGEVVNCLLFVAGVSLPEQAPGSEKTYTVQVGTRYVQEELWVCIDYGTPVESCNNGETEPYVVFATLPALDQQVLNSNPLPWIVDSTTETAEAFVEWASDQLPPI